MSSTAPTSTPDTIDLAPYRANWGTPEHVIEALEAFDRLVAGIDGARLGGTSARSTVLAA